MSMIPYYQDSISCFLEDIDPIFRIFKKNKMDLKDVSALIFSNIFKTADFQYFEISQNKVFRMVWDFLDYLKYPGVSKDK